MALAEGTDTKIVDASTAHRIDDAWVYGFPELDAAQRSKIASSPRVANPGCYATGFIAVTRPLVDAGLLKPEARLACSAVSGYSGGGKQLTAVFEEQSHEPWGAYGWNLDHKHLPEMAFHGRLEEPPVFLPAVGAFAQGMVISVPVVYGRDCSGVSKGDQLHAALQAHYAGFELRQGHASARVGVRVRGHGRATFKVMERGAFSRGTRKAQRVERSRAVRLRQRRARDRVSGGSFRQPGQGRVGRGGPEPEHHARAGGRSGITALKSHY